MAIHGNFNHLQEYKHRRHKPIGPITDVDLADIPNINMINAGETLYHMPSRGTSSIPVTPVPTLNQPRPFPPENLGGMKVNYNEKLFVDINSAPLQAGQAWKAVDGRRTILAVSSGAALAIYLLEKPGTEVHLKVFSQDGSAFYLDVKNSYIDELGRRLEPLKKAIELEVILMLGFVSCASVPAFIAVSGIGLLEWVVNNRGWLSKANDALYVTCEVHKFLLQYAPMLYRKIIEGLFHSLWDNVPNIVGNIPQAIANDPKLVASGTGVILGKLAFATFKNRFAAALLVFSLLLTIVTKAIQAVPGAIVITAREKMQYALEIVNNLRQQGVSISDLEANTIIDEVLANPEELQTHLKKLKDAFDALK